MWYHSAPIGSNLLWAYILVTWLLATKLVGLDWTLKFRLWTRKWINVRTSSFISFGITAAKQCNPILPVINCPYLKWLFQRLLFSSSFCFCFFAISKNVLIWLSHSYVNYRGFWIMHQLLQNTICISRRTWTMRENKIFLHFHKCSKCNC